MIMKSRHIIPAIAMMVLAVLAVSSCRKSPGQRRPGKEEGPKVTFTDNPDWNITYNGREVDVDGDGTFVVDPIYVSSSDRLSYFVDLISMDEYASAYRSKVESFIQGSYKNNFNADWVVSGDSRTAFNALDAGDAEWVAIAYEIDGSGKLGSNYSFCKFRTKAITMREDKSYEITYGGREDYLEKDGSISVVDRIKVKSYSDYPYYIDITYPDYIRENYSGDPVGFFNDVLDGVASGLGDGEDFTGYISKGNSDVLFDRLRHGDWTAYAFGVDNLGNLTGNWSKLNFDIEEEKASEEFSKWLGTWTIGGKATDGKTSKYYNISITSAENNSFYTVADWENNEDFLFETSFDKDKGTMLFNSQYLGSEAVKEYQTKDNPDGNCDIAFIGNIIVGKDIYSIDYLDNDYRIATATLSADGTKAEVKPERIAVSIDGQKVTSEFASMQFVDWTLDGFIYVYNEVIPALPMSMTKISGPDGTRANVMGRAMPKRKAGQAATATKAAASSQTRRNVGTGMLRQTKTESMVPGTKAGISASRRRTSVTDMQPKAAIVRGNVQHE